MAPQKGNSAAFNFWSIFALGQRFLQVRSFLAEKCKWVFFLFLQYIVMHESVANIIIVIPFL